MTGIVIVATAAIAVLAVLFIISNKVFNVAVRAKTPKQRVVDTNAEDSRDADRSVEQTDREWLRRRAFDERHLETADGLRLFGRILYAERPSRVWVVVCHGFTGNGLKMGGASRHFHRRGFNVFLPDLRGCGNSEGKYLGMGWQDSRDMLGWIDMITGIDPEAKIVLTGGSMGGATVMMTTGLALPGNVVAAVEDCGYTSVWEEFTHQLKKVFGLPRFPFMYIADGMAKRRAGYSFREACSPDRLKNSRVPTLFIHGTEDEFVPFFMLDQNYEAAACPKQKLVVEGAGHGVSANVAPELYWSTVDEFLRPYIGK